MVSYFNIECNELKKLLEQGNVVLVDVRTPEEWHEKHLEGAYLLPLNSISYCDIVELCNTLHNNQSINNNKSVNLVFYCRAGVRSIAAIEQVFNNKKEELNNYKIYNLKNGILACNL